MADQGSVDVILEFLRTNRFTRAEAALRSELSNRPDLNKFFEKLTIDDRDLSNALKEENGDTMVRQNQGLSTRNSFEVSNSAELIVKEIECGTGRNGSEEKWKNAASIGEQIKPNEAYDSNDRNFTSSKCSNDPVLDMYSSSFNPYNGLTDPYQNDAILRINNVSELQISEQSRYQTSEVLDTGKSIVKSGEGMNFLGHKGISWIGSSSNANAELKSDKIQLKESKELNQKHNISGGTYSKNNFADNTWSSKEGPTDLTSDLWQDCSVKTVFPFSMREVSTSHDIGIGSKKKKVPTGPALIPLLCVHG